ncbi:PadR family transcriptional regulator [Paenibacillus allorhizosphaerae]|nr:PadR family transcriptional regulator [Paenibacillus allorhizosphaerae]
MRLAILGLLMEADAHPYEITQKMKEREMHRYTKLQMGSLYYAVDRLAEEACIEPVEIVKDAGRPDKTIYRITEKGRKEFERLLLRVFEEYEPMKHPLYMALVFADHGDQQKLAEILDSRVRKCEKAMKVFYEVYREHIDIVPKSALHMMVGGFEHAKVELQWLTRLRDDAREGKLGEMGVPIEFTV